MIHLGKKNQYKLPWCAKMSKKTTLSCGVMCWQILNLQWLVFFVYIIIPNMFLVFFVIKLDI